MTAKQMETHLGQSTYIPRCIRCGADRAPIKIEATDKTQYDTFVIGHVCLTCYKEIVEFIDNKEMNQ